MNRVVGLLRRHCLFLLIILAISCCVTSYLQSWHLKTFMILHNFCELGIWEWLSWVVLAQNLSSGCRQAVGQSHGHLKAWWGWWGHFQAHSCGCWQEASVLLSQHSGWLPGVRNRRAREHTQHGIHSVFYNLISEVRHDHFRSVLLSHRSTLIQCGRGLHMGTNVKRGDRWGPSWRLLTMPTSVLFPWGKHYSHLTWWASLTPILPMWFGVMTLPLPTPGSRAE